jgi:potassium voltage-gated channel Shal-related subfamily D protein 2
VQHSNGHPESQLPTRQPTPDRQPLMPGSTLTRTRDLSNRKLAQNQTELSKQIVELRSMVSEQNELIRRLLEHKP